jgi:hypothetical protein
LAVAFSWFLPAGTLTCTDLPATLVAGKRGYEFQAQGTGYSISTRQPKRKPNRFKKRPLVVVSQNAVPLDAGLRNHDFTSLAKPSLAEKFAAAPQRNVAPIGLCARIALVCIYGVACGKAGEDTSPNGRILS